MKYVFRSENVELTDSIKEYVKDKLSRIEKYLTDNEVIQAKVLIKVKGREQKVEITIPTKKYMLRREESSDDLYASIDLVIDKLERQIRKYKTKLVDKKRQEVIDNSFDFIEDEENDNTKVIKRKRLTLKPMDEEEAILQMELLGHSFFVFKNVDSDKINILYKREDGNYGIIESE